MNDSAMQWAAIKPAICDIPRTLTSGQAFRWRCLPNGDWLGAVGATALLLRPADHGFAWQTYPVPGQWELIERYFALDVDLETLYAEWTEAEPRIAPAIERFRGMRILRQDAEEAFFAFQCASCNTITKITRSVNALARHYGDPICEIKGEVTYRFPTAWQIAGASETVLRRELWGFRAPRVINLARDIAERGDGWLAGLRNTSYEHAHAELVAMHGIGAKIADCVCAFGLGFDQAVPVDTHIWKMAVRLWRPDLATKSLTPSVYSALADATRVRFGAYAGWAQQYLFAAQMANLFDNA